jgi:hypothetical protein
MNLDFVLMLQMLMIYFIGDMIDLHLKLLTFGVLDIGRDKAEFN